MRIPKHKSAQRFLTLEMIGVAVFPLLLSMLVTGCGQRPSEVSARPNIVIFLADDAGYRDLNAYGGIPDTPNIDRLAENGLKFTDFYAPAPNCSPSRAGLLTGRNPNRLGIYSYRLPNHSMHLKDGEVTIAELLKQVGYRTAMFGKWHLSDLVPAKGRKKQPTPGDQGFDYWLATENNAQPSHYNPVNFVRNGQPQDTLKGYSSHILAREANTWLDTTRSDQPFLLYMPFHEVHKKIASPDSLIRKYSGKNDPEYQANVENMDAAVGKVIRKLKTMGKLQNTLIVFSSDNGSYRYGSNGKLRGFKGESFEGGVRVPGIIYWPRRITASRAISMPAGLIDLLPTIADVTGLPEPGHRKIDGESLLPLINGKQIHRSKPLVWFFYRAYPEFGMRKGRYVLNGYTRDSVPRTHYLSDRAMSFIKKARLRDFKLYDIEQDPRQRHDISRQHPQVFDSLKTEASRFFRDMIEAGPYWDRLPEYHSKYAQPKRHYMRNQQARWDMKQ